MDNGTDVFRKIGLLGFAAGDRAGRPRPHTITGLDSEELQAQIQNAVAVERALNACKNSNSQTSLSQERLNAKYDRARQRVERERTRLLRERHEPRDKHGDSLRQSRDRRKQRGHQPHEEHAQRKKTDIFAQTKHKLIPPIEEQRSERQEDRADGGRLPGQLQKQRTVTDPPRLGREKTNLQGLARERTGVQGLARERTGLQGLARERTGLQGLARERTGLQGITREKSSLQGLTGLYDTEVKTLYSQHQQPFRRERTFAGRGSKQKRVVKAPKPGKLNTSKESLNSDSTPRRQAVVSKAVEKHGDDGRASRGSTCTLLPSEAGSVTIERMEESQLDRVEDSKEMEEVRLKESETVMMDEEGREKKNDDCDEMNSTKDEPGDTETTRPKQTEKTKKQTHKTETKSRRGEITTNKPKGRSQVTHLTVKDARKHSISDGTRASSASKSASAQKQSTISLTSTMSRNDSETAEDSKSTFSTPRVTFGENKQTSSPSTLRSKQTDVSSTGTVQSPRPILRHAETVSFGVQTSTDDNPVGAECDSIQALQMDKQTDRRVVRSYERTDKSTQTDTPTDTPSDTPTGSQPDDGTLARVKSAAESILQRGRPHIAPLQKHRDFHLTFGLSDFCLLDDNQFAGLVFVKRLISTFDENGRKLTTISPCVKRYPVLKMPCRIFCTSDGKYIVIDGKMGKFLTIVLPSSDGKNAKTVAFQYNCSDIAMLNKNTLIAVSLREPELVLVDPKTAGIKHKIDSRKIGLPEACYVATNRSRRIALVQKDCDMRIIDMDGNVLAYFQPEERDLAKLSAGHCEAYCVCLDEDDKVYLGVHDGRAHCFKVLVFDHRLRFLGVGLDKLTEKIIRIAVTQSGDFILGDTDAQVTRYHVPPVTREPAPTERTDQESTDHNGATTLSEDCR